jgi:hypothetical protein
MDFEAPRDRHDNEKRDITQIAIIPTEREIRTGSPEFLPSPLHSGEHFLQGVDRLFDTYFRLHRHDILGEVKHVIKDLLDYSLRDTKQNDRIQLFSLKNTSAFTYNGAGVTYIRSTRKHGIEVQIRFRTPLSLQQSTASQRRKWWNTTKRLENGTLLCLILFQDGKGTPIFFTVSEKNTNLKDKFSLLSYDGPVISGKLTSTITTSQLSTLVVNFHRTDGLLVEFPGVVPATFMPVLENLQNMRKDGRSNLSRWLLEPEPDKSRIFIPPPRYTRLPEFAFDLSPIIIDPTISMALKPGVNSADIQKKLRQSTTLDEGQCEALVAALSREFALIQGPPGTGKSHVGIQLVRVLLANKSKASLGPIIVVCYTNHALDQFLEHLIAAGVEKIMRIGGNGSSKMLKGKNLRTAPKHQYKSSSEARKLGLAFETKELGERILLKHLERLYCIQNNSWHSARAHLRWNYSKIYQQFLFSEKDGSEKTARVAPFHLWLSGNEETSVELNGPCNPPTLNNILSVAVKNVHSLALPDRAALANHWASEITDDAISHISSSIRQIDESQAIIDLVHGEVSRRLLETVDVIGVTTTGLAKNASVLRSINAKVVICEEAAEISEAHMLSIFMPDVQHFIQIGDHEQLRPQVTNFGLFSLESNQGKRYQLDRSLFERLAKRELGSPPFPITQLNIQRRMRPEISRLVRDTLYPRLLDHPDTQNLPDVVGMRKNVFWYHHTNLEERSQDIVRGKSHSNDSEVHMTHALVRHIVCQGVYTCNEIVVLTPYADQLRKLQMKLRSSFDVALSDKDKDQLDRSLVEGKLPNLEEDLVARHKRNSKQVVQNDSMKQSLRIATVDNFQGEEAEVVIISLVRSNKLENAGFLKTTNRINVLLSRAKHGMYIIGNADTYANVPMWSQVLDTLRETESAGTAFSLCCPRHQALNILVSKPEDFEILSPEGGCREICNR